MNRTLKHVVMGAVPAICGATGVSVFGEKISWPERPSARESFAATQAAASQPSPAVKVPVRTGVGGIGGRRP